MKVAAIWISHRIWTLHFWLTQHAFLWNLHLFLEWFGGYPESMRQFDLRDGGSGEPVVEARVKCGACGHVFPFTAIALTKVEAATPPAAKPPEGECR